MLIGSIRPWCIRKFAEGIGILSKNDVIDADLLARYGLMAKKWMAFEPAPQEINDLRSLLNRLDVLEKNIRRELNWLEKAGETLTFHRLEQQSITRSIKRHEAEIAFFLGLNPIEKRSGKSEYRKPRLSKSGSTHYRQALYFPAMVATRKNPDVQALYERLVVAGKPKMCALGAAMRKLVHICYGVYKNQQPYQPQVSPT